MKLNIDFHQFLPTILNSWEYDLLYYMLIMCPKISINLINNFDVVNSIILILIQLIQKSNNEYITFLENTRPAEYFDSY